MLLIETSALVAIVFREPGYGQLIHRIGEESKVAISAASLAEALLVIERRIGSEGIIQLQGLVNVIGALVLPFDETQAGLAHQAYIQYGKGRHPASLNFGDCLAYAAAKAAGARLLYVGEDFAQTDLA